jgi:hypothetical protein
MKNTKIITSIALLTTVISTGAFAVSANTSVQTFPKALRGTYYQNIRFDTMPNGNEIKNGYAHFNISKNQMKITYTNSKKQMRFWQVWGAEQFKITKQWGSHHTFYYHVEEKSRDLGRINLGLWRTQLH